MKCPYCDAIVPRGKTVCGFCGEPLPEMNPPVRSSKDEAGSFSPDKGPTPVSTEASMTHEQLQNDDNNGYYLQEERQSHVEVENKTPEETYASSGFCVSCDQDLFHLLFLLHDHFLDHLSTDRTSLLRS